MIEVSNDKGEPVGLSEEERKRYTRQMMMDGWGETGQEKLKKSTVFIAGAGGLGSPAAIYLAVAGVGNIRICDFDVPDLTNLNRQILHDKSRIGINKTLSARTTLASMNANVKVTALQDKITASSIDALVANADVIVDCMDNFPTRYILNEAAVRKHIPLIYGSVWGMDGRLSFIYPPETPCFRCLFHEGPPPGTFPIVGAVPGVIGSLQALEALKYLTGIGSNLKGKQLVWEGSTMTFKTLRMFTDPACPVCGPNAKSWR